MTKRVILVATQCYPPDVGGIETFLGDLAEAFYRAGWPVEVFANYVHSTKGRPVPVGPVLHRFSGPSPLRRRWKAFRIAQRLKRGDVAAIFADSWKSVELLPASVTKVPVVVMIHGTEIPDEPSPSKAARLNRAFSHATVLCMNSRDTQQRLAGHVPAGLRTQVVLQPCTDQPEPDAATLEAVRARIGSQRPLIVTIARLEPRKGVETLIRAVALLRAEFPAIKFAVGGGGDDLKRLEGIAAELGVSDHIVFLGRLTEGEKAALFALGDVFAMTAYRVGRSIESFGKVYIEAAWAGLASVAGNDGGVPDAVIDGETGLLCDGRSPQDAAAALGRILRDPALRTRLAAAAQRRAREEFNWTVGVQKFLALAGL